MDLKELIARVEKATGPDRELDNAIKLVAAAHLFATGATKDEAVSALGGDLYDDPLPYTASLDAAVELCERNLPNPWWRVTRAKQTCVAEVRLYDGAVYRDYEGAFVPTPALALILATLRAINGEQNG